MFPAGTVSHYRLPRTRDKQAQGFGNCGRCILKAQGQARHHFWGEYAQSIALRFASPEVASKARERLNSTLPETKAKWNIPDKVPFCLSVFASGADLDAITASLASFGADLDKVQSLRFSVDCGEPFEIEIPEGEQTLIPFPG